MQATFRFGSVEVYLGEKSGKYPDGNQVIVQGGDTRVAFDTPVVANRIGPAFDDVELVILGHVHEDHMAGLHRVPTAKVHVHEADLQAARSWEGLGKHYGYTPRALAELKALIERACLGPRRRRPGPGPPPARAYVGPLRARRGERGHRLHRRYRPVGLRPLLR